MTDNKQKISLQALGQAMDSSFTRSSASSGPVLAVRSIKAGFTPGEKLKIKVVYSCVVNMVRDRDIRESKAQYEKEGDVYIDAAIKQIAKDYKDLVIGEDHDAEVEEIAEDNSKGSIKFKRLEVDTSIEIIDLNVHNQKRTALFRRLAFFEVA